MDASANQVWIIAKIFGLQGVDHAQQLLGNMSQCNPVRFALGPLFGVVFGKDRFMSDEGEAAVHKGVSELRRTVLDHMACKLGLAGLEIPRLQASKGKHLGGCRVTIDIGQ